MGCTKLYIPIQVLHLYRNEGFVEFCVYIESDGFLKGPLNPLCQTSFLTLTQKFIPNICNVWLRLTTGIGKTLHHRNLNRTRWVY